MTDLFISTVCRKQDDRRFDSAICHALPRLVSTPDVRVTIFCFHATEVYKNWLVGTGRFPVGDFRIYFSSPFEDLSWELQGSERRRFLFAERLVRSDVYVVSDDDLIPVGDDWLQRALTIMRQKTDYGMLCLLDADQTDHVVARPGKEETEEIIETGSGGGIRLIRRGAIKSFPGYRGYYGYDGAHGEAFYENGWKVGFMRKVRRRNLGNGLHVVRSVPWFPNPKELDRPDGSMAEI